MDSDQLEYFRIFDEEIVAVVSSRHPLALRGSVKLQDLIREPWSPIPITTGPGTG